MSVDLGGVFNAHAVAPSVAMEALPAGNYNAIITDSELKRSAPKDGQMEGNAYIELTFEVIDGPYKGRKTWDRLNIGHDDPKVVAIAQSTLSAICHAISVFEVPNTALLHNRPMLIVTKSEEYPKGSGNFSNKVKGYKAYAGPVAATAPVAAPGPVGFGAAPVAPAAPAAGFQGFGAPAAPPAGMAPGFQLPGQQTAPAAPVQAPGGFGGFPAPAGPYGAPTAPQAPTGFPGAAPAAPGAAPAFGAPPAFPQAPGPAAWGQPR